MKFLYSVISTYGNVPYILQTKFATVNTEIIITLTRIAGGASCPDTSTRIVSYLSKFMPV